ncbi:hypothetical protein D3C75_1294210 [compost metagenome]
MKNGSGDDRELEPQYFLDIGNIEDGEIDRMKGNVMKAKDMSYLDTLFVNRHEEQGIIIALSGEKDILFT